MNWKSLWPYILTLFLIGIVLMFVPYWLTRPNANGIAFSKTGEIGDTVGGTTAPFIGFFGVVFTFLAFWIQYEANKQLRSDIEKDRFETKFYELLKLHKDNVSEIDIAGKYYGRKAFVWMYKELRFLYHICESELAKERSIKGKSLSFQDRMDLTELSYILFFFGIGEVSDKGSDYYTSHFDNREFLNKCLKKCREIQEEFDSKYDSKKGKDGYLTIRKNLFYGRYNFEIDFYPFDGHVSKLGHYYRHLYQTIKYLGTSEIIKKYKLDHYSYVKTLRAQLSNHEQTLVYFNSFFRTGQIWWRESEEFQNDRNQNLSYFFDHKIIKNLPFNLTDFGPLPNVLFKHRYIDRNRTWWKEHNYSLQQAKDEVKCAMTKLFEWNGG